MRGICRHKVYIAAINFYSFTSKPHFCRALHDDNNATGTDVFQSISCTLQKIILQPAGENGYSVRKSAWHKLTAFPSKTLNYT